jgi:hypothetical protein
MVTTLPLVLERGVYLSLPHRRGGAWCIGTLAGTLGLTTTTSTRKMMIFFILTTTTTTRKMMNRKEEDRDMKKEDQDRGNRGGIRTG